MDQGLIQALMQTMQQAQTTNNPQQFMEQMIKNNPSAAQQIQTLLSTGAKPKELFFTELRKRGIDPTMFFGK